jgi:hypothetical protein|tara:strand:+ start:250 stop:423 length:174 start_codon:yes stop_codon:yes gene_type:complete
MADIKEHIEQIIDLLVGSALPDAMRGMVLSWLSNQPEDEMRPKLSTIKQYLNDQDDI